MTTYRNLAACGRAMAWLCTLSLPGATIALGADAPAPAPLAPATSEAAASDDNPIVLNPFTVSTTKDKGYKPKNRS